MTKQLRIAGVDPPQQIQPDPDRLNPPFWVRRVVILKELRPENENVIRNVELRRGLNVVWTPPLESSADNALFQNAVAGHTAGKTTFCRLIRYVLGEQSFATESSRKRIRDRFPKGWVLAEIFVEQELWTVARPLGFGSHPFCVPGATISQVHDVEVRSEYQIFLDALAAATIGELPSKYLPTSDVPVRWEHILPWLTRDQECRFADFLEWRHSTSGAEAPALTVDERQFVVRSVLGLINDAERSEQRRNAQLLREKKEAVRQAPILAHQATVDHGRVQELLDATFDHPSTSLFASQARLELQRQMADLEARMSDLASSDRRTELGSALELAIKVEANARRDLDDVVSRLQVEEAALDALTAPPGQEQSLLATLPPPRDYCNVPLSLARECGCSLAQSRPIELSTRRSEIVARDELGAQRQLVMSLSALKSDKEHAMVVATQAVEIARRAVFDASASYDARREQLLMERARLSQVERLVSGAEQAWSNSVGNQEVVERLSREIDASYAKQEAIRQVSLDAVQNFSATFDFVLRALLGDEFVARVDTSGRSLTLVVEHRGERDSAALATVKLLAFDFAALVESIQGLGQFPRFLLHDGPREADMAPEIYERVFYFATQLEKCFQEEASFQYIITTTTKPPDEVLSDPWLRLTLSGAYAEERLLRCDL